mmetsp:Transcript_41630/g.50495  ORF Transcript_41630/g.50495 Transcript_41630/m.50495 type:complete len:224 (-) Transcript_41630:285-956(-)|eukprot:CAMPEP_0197852348 /NCGR_PEP_ID=MMETSP1438-20131217/20340_1 /TAXON_ID=1461541 /ORGANISM="Pterosperma sp., Strain CCMP1384" /LENGTH=223 /DNA_ID=CAMNT_0043466351 /DNA_START=49 /DNA_END=720 /DNA_ORIENTATION=+
MARLGVRCVALFVCALVLQNFAASATAEETSLESPKKFTDAEGEVWYEIFDPASERTYFENEKTKAVTWYDPRQSSGAKLQEPETFYHKDVLWQVHTDPQHGQKFFYNTATQESIWTDPRTGQRPKSMKAPKGKKNVYDDSATGYDDSEPLPKSTALTIILVPFATFGAALAGRIYYLQQNYPEMLNPTKERKVRKKGWGVNKFKQGSNRMSQDGKGGRSANS